MNMPPADKIKQFFDDYPENRFEKGQILIHANEDPPGVFYIESGQIRQYHITDQGTEVVVNTYKPGAFFPMSWAINQAPNLYFFDAAEASSVRRAPAQAAVDFLQTNPDVAFDLLRRVFFGLDGLLRRMALLMGGDAHSRFLFELIVVCQRFGQQQPDGSYLIKITEGELAKRAGLSRETVSRLLAREPELLHVGHGGLVVKDLGRLERALG